MDRCNVFSAREMVARAGSPDVVVSGCQAATPPKKPAPLSNQPASDNQASVPQVPPANAHGHASRGSTLTSYAPAPTLFTSTSAGVHSGLVPTQVRTSAETANRRAPVQAGSVAQSLGAHGGGVGQSSAAPARQTYTGAVTVPGGGNNYYRPPQVRGITQPAGKATKSTGTDPSQQGISESPTPASVMADGGSNTLGAANISTIPQRRILAVTLSLLRSRVAIEAAKNIQWQRVMDFLHRVVPVDGGVPEHDKWLPSIVVTYK